jgi:hypothetical protein
MTVNLSPVGGVAQQFFTDDGVPLSGGLIYTYAAGTTTSQTTYTSSIGNIAHTNPIILNSAGRVPGGEIWVTNGITYKFVLKDSTNVLIATYDNIGGILTSYGTAFDISYTPPFAASVTTTVGDKLAQYVSVKDYGAVGDGVADDTAAIAAALADNDTIFFPSGEYLVSGNINIQNKTVLGNSWRDTIIQLSGNNTNTPVFINSATSASAWGSGNGFTLDNLTVKGNWDGSTVNPVNIDSFDNLGSVIRWHAGAYVNVSNCKIQDSFAHGLAFDRLGYSYFQFNEITTNKYDGIHLNGPSQDESITSTWVSNNSIHSCRGTACIYLKNGLTMQATQNVLEDAVNGFYVDGNDNRAVAFCFNDMEQMSGYGVRIEGSGTFFQVSSNFLGVTNPIYIANSPEFRQGNFTNNAFSNLDYVTSMPVMGSGTTTNTVLNFFGIATSNAVTGIIGWRSNNLANTDTEVEIAGVHYGTSSQRGGQLVIGTVDPSTGVMGRRFWIDQVGNTYPNADNAQTLGTATNRWSVVYAATGAINTSDKNQKQDIRDLDASEKAVAIEMKSLLKSYRFKDSVSLKGDAARIHFGAVAQDVADVFAKHDLDANRYGLFCSDTWYVDADGKTYPSEFDTEGTPIDGLIPVTQLGLRYDELLAFIIQGL